MPQPSFGSGSVPIASASASRVGCSAMSIPARSRIASRRVIRRQGGAKSISTLAALDLRRPQHPLGDLGDEQLEVVRGLLVVGVGLVPLEHRELGVVLVGDALVAEVLAELVDAVDAADDEALEVELGRDPQVEVAVERVVVGGERAAPGRRRRAAAGPASRPRRSRARRTSGGSRRSSGRGCGRSRGSPRWRSGRARGGGSGSRCPRGRGTCRAAGAGSWPAGASGRSPARARRRGGSPSPSPRRRRCRRGRGRPAARRPRRRARPRGRAAGSGRCRRGGRGSRPCRGRGGRRSARRPGGASRSRSPPPAPRGRPAPRRCPRARRTRAGTARSPPRGSARASRAGPRGPAESSCAARLARLAHRGASLPALRLSRSW